MLLGGEVQYLFILCYLDTPLVDLSILTHAAFGERLPLASAASRHADRPGRADWNCRPLPMCG